MAAEEPEGELERYRTSIVFLRSRPGRAALPQATSPARVRQKQAPRLLGSALRTDTCPVSWRSFLFAPRNSIKEKARLRLREFDVRDRFSHLPLARASVLLPLMVRAGKLHLLLTVRSMQLRRSPGEVCFPGGKSDAADKDEIDTALREAKEEVGLQPEKVEVICRLVPGIDKMNYLVTPVVGFIEDTFQPSPNPDEVSNVFVMPLEYFIKPLNYQTVHYKTSSGYHGRMHSFTYDDPEHEMSFRIWGLTAHFAVFLALVIFRRRPTFEVDYDLDNLTSSSENYFMNLYASVYERKKSNI
ncbi:peroxisomal coenzyme A diphosphatase NUDT7 [Lathamus discolor]|uniref:peroxisomal coenzyme A diphosphatase NUDT7 n=1 Tax=Lathamus discolor TaxID=678569 RepID=UPI0032B80AF6